MIFENKQIEIHFKAFIGSNIGTIWDRTKSLDEKKYIILINQIVKKRIESGCVTSTSFVNKEIKIKNERLTADQIKAMELIRDNQSILRQKVEKFINNKKREIARHTVL